MLNDQHIPMKCFEDEALRACLRPDGYVHVYVKDHTTITPAVQDRILEVYDSITQIPRGLIFEAGEFVSLSREAQSEVQKLRKYTPTRASAIIVKDLSQRIIIDYFLRNAPPKNPFKVVRDMNEALNWLNAQ
jgi:hypothetical protein